jgi:excisionase family DNA binding protein
MSLSRNRTAHALPVVSDPSVEPPGSNALKPLALPVETACKIVGVGRTTMWSLITAGRVQTARIGRRRLVIFASLEALVNSNAESAS